MRRADHLQKACEILLQNGCESTRACGLVENIGREGTSTRVLTLGELKNTAVNMFTTVFIGNSQSIIRGERLITTRGYKDK